MARQEIKGPITDSTLSNANHNFIELYGVVNDLVGTITGDIYEQVIDGSKLIWNKPVDLYEDLPADASEGDTRMVRYKNEDHDVSGIVYRYDGEAWKEIQQIDAGPINDLDRRVSEGLADTVKKSDYKKFFLDKSDEVYLYDLELQRSNSNQGLAVDEEKEEFYATQALTIGDDKVESYVISHLSLDGKLIGHMTVRQGGHGTAIGIETDNDKVYVWSNMIKIDSSGNIETQILCRFPYQENKEISINHSSVERLMEFPDRYQSMYPFCDNKNGILALCHSDSTTDPRSRRITTYNLDIAKQGDLKEINTFNFTNKMNESILQGLAVDGDEIYVSFGVDPKSMVIYQIDMNVGEIKAENQGLSYVEGEPEGLFLYTDLRTRYKTLLTVVSNKGRQHLVAFSWNNSAQKFIGMRGKNAQNLKLTGDDGKAKRLEVTSLESVTNPGQYYFTTVETSDMVDHPKPGVAGWWLDVSGKDANGSVYQTLIRNSLDNHDILFRIVRSDGETTSWKNIVNYEETGPMKPNFINGWTNYYTDHDLLTYYKNAVNQLVISGVIKNKDPKSTSVVCNLPSDFRPKTKHSFFMKGGGSVFVEVIMEKNGDLKVGSLMGSSESEYVFINCVVSLL